MGNEAFDPTGFSGIVPLFPLPNVVLFPGMFLPLHVFEPRYRAMTADALQGERLIAMALLKPGWQQNYEGAPPVHEILGMGKIVEDARLPDGRFNLVLFGLARVRLMKEVGFGAYRTAQVEILEEGRAEVPAADRRRRTLLALYTQIMKDLMKGGIPAPPDDVPLGMLCDLVASLVLQDPAARQGLLEELDSAARCDRLLKLLEGAAPRPPWPRGPSLN
ncbi:MAG: LON peptidase substrate-binding domain-containing protein [Planctomycetes bacterium]|nr:LON peptidase substrate-binding domain-containing protein [Planctomycetota bacterium]